MATIANNSKSVLGPFNPTKTILTAADVLVYAGIEDQNSELIMYNITASAVVVTIDGSGATAVVVPGAGSTTANIAAGLAVTVPANGFTVVRLDTISAYLTGTVAVTGGVGVIATIIY